MTGSITPQSVHRERARLALDDPQGECEALHPLTQAQAQRNIEGSLALPHHRLIVNVVEYVANVPDEVPWAAQPLAYFGGVSMVAGIWKGGKSTLISQLQSCRETGGTFLGHAVPRGPTLLVTEEGGVAVKRKVSGLSRLDIIDRRAAVTARLSFDSLLAQIAEWCQDQQQPAVVCIDTLAVWGEIEDENCAAEMTAVVKKVSMLAQSTDAAVILVHHSRKEGGTHGRSIRGSGAIAATVDIYAVLDYTSGPATNRSLKLEGRVIEPTDLTLTYDPETGYALDTGGDVGEYEAWLDQVPSDGDGFREAALVNLWGIPRTSARRRIAKLLEIGRLRESLAKHPGDRLESFRYWSMPAVIPFRKRRDEDENASA